jgi:Flp pilus assembly protein CpaB
MNYRSRNVLLAGALAVLAALLTALYVASGSAKGGSAGAPAQPAPHRPPAVRAHGVLAQLAGTMRAIEIAGEPDQLLAGMLRSGDRVDVVASVKSGGDLPRSRIVLSDLLVLRAPRAPADDGTGAAPTVRTTLRVDVREAQTLFYVVKNADWALMLRPVVRPRNARSAVASAASVLGGLR